MLTHFYLADVFGVEKYTGNQLATFIDSGALTGEDMQRIAREINFSETTFITAAKPVDGAWPVRIFTPRSEVDFAGHPTLGTAWIIREKILRQPVADVVLDLKVGRIPVTFEQHAGQPLLWMRQRPPVFGKTWAKADCAALLGLALEDIAAGWPVLEVSTGFPHWVVPLRDMDALRRARVDRDRYFSWAERAGAKNILVFAAGSYRPGQTLAVRVFADYFGTPEDAATGSGNGCLAAYLVRTRYLGSDAVDIEVGQGYGMGRPSALYLRSSSAGGEHSGGGADDIEVAVGGSVIEVAQGSWG